MHDHARDASLLESTGQDRCGQRLVIPAQPHLHSHRNAHSVDHGRDELGRTICLAHECRAAPVLDDFANRAAHVDIDGCRPLLFDPRAACCISEYDVAVDLDRERAIASQVSASSNARRRFSISERALTRSVVASPNPPHWRTASRNARLVYPASGARKNRDGIAPGPDESGCFTMEGTRGSTHRTLRNKVRTSRPEYLDESRVLILVWKPASSTRPDEPGCPPWPWPVAAPIESRSVGALHRSRQAPPRPDWQCPNAQPR